jgi:hypothetical protein
MIQAPDFPLDFLRPCGTDSAFIVSSNGNFRSECRPHSAIGHRAPKELMKQSGDDAPA